MGCKNEATLNLSPWTSLNGLKFTGLSMTNRIKQLLDCVCMQVCGGARETERILSLSPEMARNKILDLMKDVVLDVSQNPGRRAFSNRLGMAKCLTTSSILYSYRLDRVIFPFEKMLWQGHSVVTKIPSSMSNRELDDLAGIGIQLPSLGLLVVALMSTTGLWLSSGCSGFWTGNCQHSQFPLITNHPWQCSSVGARICICKDLRKVKI